MGPALAGSRKSASDARPPRLTFHLRRSLASSAASRRIRTARCDALARHVAGGDAGHPTAPWVGGTVVLVEAATVLVVVDEPAAVVDVVGCTVVLVLLLVVLLLVDVVVG